MRRVITTLLAASAISASCGLAQAQQYQPYSQPQYGQPQYGQPQYAPTQYGQPSGNPLTSIFQCQNPGNRQGQGAIIGGLIGGIAGNQLAGGDSSDKTLGTVLGAAVGAAAGSYIGCNMGQGDQQRAQAATQSALAQGRSQAWANPQSGASGRVDIVDTYNYGYNTNQYAPPPAPSINNVRWTQGVEQPREYLPSEGTYQAVGAVNIRSGPSVRASQVGQLRNGETFDGLVRVEGTDWVLASQNGVAIGYVSETNLRFLGETARQPARQQPPRYDPRQPTCRVFDQTYTPRGGQAQTQRYTACQSASGEWLVQA